MFVTLTWLDLSIVISAVFGTFLIATHIRGTRETSAETGAPEHSHKTLTFEFDLGGNLVCSTIEGDQFLKGLNLIDPDWDDIRRALKGRFPEIPNNPDMSDDMQTTVFEPVCAADPMEIAIEPHALGVTLSLRPRTSMAKDKMLAAHYVFSSLPDLSLVHEVSERAPFPVWQTLENGEVGWSNAFYQALDQRITREADQPLFAMLNIRQETTHPQRVTLKDVENNRTHWFDVTTQNYEGGNLHFAIDIHAVISAESTQRNFVQTLAKTFAHLTTGLAIFDRKRQLVLFNPSLLDITELRPDFLTARPNLFSFFDQLRNNQIMPEPKNYANWRERVADVISAASDDNFNETWHLPNGLTYRVTGRPHPDGAIAFLFEDISAEISLTRRFRSEANVTRSAFDSLEQAIAIFNQGGFLEHCNLAMGQFLGMSADECTESLSVREISRRCQKACKPSAVWGEIRDFVAGATERETWTTDIVRKDGQYLELRVSPLASGASLIALTPKEVKSTVSLNSRHANKQDHRSSTEAA